MPFDVVQCHGKVAGFSNHEIISHNRSNLYSVIILQQVLPVLLLFSSIKFLLEIYTWFAFSTCFQHPINTRYVASFLCNIFYLTWMPYISYFHTLYFIIFKRSSDVEENPGPQHNPCKSFSIFHWNLNCIYSHNCVKLPLIRSLIEANKCDI